MKRQTTGRASDYIVHLKILVLSRRTLRVVLYCRVSRCWQSKNGNLKDQKRYLLRIIRKYQKRYNVRIDIVAVFQETASGWAEDRTKLIDAARTAKVCNAVLVAESSCRFLRSGRFHSSQKPDVLPTIYEYENLMKDTEGATLASIMPPDRPWKKVRSSQTKRGQRSKKTCGGRPPKKYPGYKKERQKKYLELVLQLLRDGYSVADIVRETGIHRSTINDWKRKYDK